MRKKLTFFFLVVKLHQRVKNIKWLFVVCFFKEYAYPKLSFMFDERIEEKVRL